MTTRDPNSPRLFNLDHGFCDPALTEDSKVAVFRLRDGTRVELFVRGAVAAYVCDGQRVESHQLHVVRRGTGRHHLTVDIIQVAEFSEIIGAPEARRALEHYSAGRLKDAARYAAAAGEPWRALVDLLGGPA